MKRIARGEPSSIPPLLALHLVAATYGTTPDAVRDWPADDYMAAVRLLPATRA